MTSLLLANVAHLALVFSALGLLLSLLHLQERTISRYLAHHLGWRSVMLTGWLGVTIHELSHLVACWIFGHRIIAWRLFDPDPVTGTLGYVRHAYRRRSLRQLLGSFFIGIAPLVGGTIALVVILCWMVPYTRWLDIADRGTLTAIFPSTRLLLDQLTAVVAEIWQHRSGWLPVQFYLAACVVSHMAPSGSDLRGALPGAGLLLVLLMALSGVAAHYEVLLWGGEASVGLMILILLIAGLLLGTYAACVGMAVWLFRTRRDRPGWRSIDG